MKRIRTLEEAEKKKKTMRFLIGFVMIFLMVFSTAGFALLNGSGQVSDPDINNDPNTNDIRHTGKYWVYEKEGQEFYFTKLQELAERVPVDVTHDLSIYASSSSYIVSDDPETITEILINLDRFSPRIQEACLGTCEKNLPEKTCEDNLIVYKEGEENRVYQEENCVFIEGDITSVDAFLYNILGF